MEEFALFLKNKQIDMRKYDFSKGSTIGVGGLGNAVFPRSFTELIDVIDGCEKRKIEYRVLGNLSNVLPPESGGETLYIMTKGLSGVTMGEAPLVHTGVTAAQLLKECKKQGRGGAEFLAGIPCTVGGAAYMNAGVAGRYFAEIVRSVIVYEKGCLKTYSKEECGYAYKKSRFMDGGVIFGVILDLSEETPQAVSDRIEYYLQRRSKLPKGKSMGCVFKNPDGVSAGKLIEDAGLKGLRVGGATVSETHANFIINDCGATVSDVKALIKEVKAAVYEHSGVCLTEEICYL
ncbi:MAG: UDP-N-acetylmuramate dehydrogenase [Clostridia bacterium]|nr:UDP-N-acetylmuramate dehydrogenase [Clostridia bacterium]